MVNTCLTCKYATQTNSYCRCTLSGEIYSKEELCEFIREIEHKCLSLQGLCSMWESNQLDRKDDENV